MLRNAVILQKRKKLPFWSFDIFNWQLCNRNCQMSSVGASFASSLFIFLPNHFVNFKGRTAVVFAFVGVFRLPQHFLDRTLRNCFFSRLFDRVCQCLIYQMLRKIHEGPVDFSSCQFLLPKQFKDHITTWRKQLKLQFEKSIFNLLLFASETNFI